MPDPITQQGSQSGISSQRPVGQPAGQAGDQPSGQQQPTQQPQEPTWFARLTDEAERKEAREGWLRDADYRRKTQEISDKEKTWQKERADFEAEHNKYQTWLRDTYQPFYQKLQEKWAQIAPIFNGQAQQNPQQQPPQQGQEWTENYDVLPPAEQAKRIADYVGRQVLGQQIQQLEQRFLQTLNEREGRYQNFLSIMTDAYGRKFQNPNLDLNAYIKEALAVQSGQRNPLDIAYGNLTRDDDLKVREEAAYRKGREDHEQELKNQQQNPGALQNQVIPLFKLKPLTRDQVSESVRVQAAKANLPW